MFRLLELEIRKHENPLLAGQVFKFADPDELPTYYKHSDSEQLDFIEVENEEDNSLIYYTVLIGQNGTGKSELLGYLVSIFNDLKLRKVGANNKRNLNYRLKYAFGTEIHEIDTSKKDEDLEKTHLPSRWLAASNTINDKYAILNYNQRVAIPEYRYLGIRSATNNAFIGQIKTVAVANLFSVFIKGRGESVKTLHAELGFSNRVKIELSLGAMYKWKKVTDFPKSMTDMTKSHIEVMEGNKFGPRYKFDSYKRQIDDPGNIEMAYEYLKRTVKRKAHLKKSQIKLEYDIDFSDDYDALDILVDWNAIKTLLDLEILKISSFELFKNSHFTFEKASSGENHLISSFYGIINAIESDGVLLIDEPEVSLHPNWQLNYIDILKKILKPYGGIHVIIATHSHFLISGLKNHESRVLAIKPDKDLGLRVEPLDYETYGWDPERILFKIFGVVNQRNKYFEFDVSRLIQLVSQNAWTIKEKDTMLRLAVSLKQFITEEEDPLRIIIDKAYKVINS